MTTEKTTEPLWWGLFSLRSRTAFCSYSHRSGRLRAATGWIRDSGRLYRIWWVKLYLFILIVLPLYHWGHRTTLAEPHGIKSMSKLLAVLCYAVHHRNGRYSMDSLKGMISSEPSFSLRKSHFPILLLTPLDLCSTSAPELVQITRYRLLSSLLNGVVLQITGLSIATILLIRPFFAQT